MYVSQEMKEFDNEDFKSWLDSLYKPGVIKALHEKSRTLLDTSFTPDVYEAIVAKSKIGFDEKKKNELYEFMKNRLQAIYDTTAEKMSHFEVSNKL